MLIGPKWNPAPHMFFFLLGESSNGMGYFPENRLCLREGADGVLTQMWVIGNGE